MSSDAHNDNNDKNSAAHVLIISALFFPRNMETDKRLKHNEACRRSRRSHTLCKTAYQLAQVGRVEVFVAIKDQREVTYKAIWALEIWSDDS